MTVARSSNEAVGGSADLSSAVRRHLSSAVHSAETFFDRLKLGYKWRFNRFFNLNVVTYRGFGSQERVWFRGRVLDDHSAVTGDHDSVWRNVTTTLRRIETDEIPGATVRVRFYDAELELETDESGFFDAVLEPRRIDRERLWHEVHVELLRPLSASREPIFATGQVIIPDEDVEFGLISDLDDTVIRTGAQNRLQMGRVVLLNNASTRTPFPGVASFYRALQGGPDRQGHNPIFYVSSSPWNLYSLFVDFLESHDVPPGPVLLRDYGFVEGRSFTGSHRSHKLERVAGILGAFPALQFVLIGDSGQKDPEIYREIVQTHAGRIRAVFIRDVTPPGRDEQVRAIAREVEAQGVPMALVKDTVEAARKAVELGLLAQDSMHDVVSSQAVESRKRHRPRVLERLLGYLPSFAAS